jgi:hypothetical protein
MRIAIIIGNNGVLCQNLLWLRSLLLTDRGQTLLF